jgi:hypothetical protein
MLYELRDLRNFKAERSSECDELRQQLNDEQSKALQAQQSQAKNQLGTICKSAQIMFSQCSEDLQNSSTISYPPRKYS